MHDESTGRSAFLKAGYPYKLKTPWLLYGALNSSTFIEPRGSLSCLQWCLWFSDISVSHVYLLVVP